MATKSAPGELNAQLRRALRDLRDASALLRVKATTMTLANKRLLREIRKKLKKPAL